MSSETTRKPLGDEPRTKDDLLPNLPGISALGKKLKLNSRTTH